MIRDYSPEDRDRIIAMVQKGDTKPADEVIEVLNTYRCLVHSDGRGLRGVGCLRVAGPGEHSVRIYVDPAHRREGIGAALWGAVLADLKVTGATGRVTVKYRSDKGGSQGFYAARGFEPWYAMDYLRYSGPRFPAPALDVRPYDDRYFQSYIRMRSDAFFPVRKSFDHKPHRIFEQDNTEEYRQACQRAREDMFLAFDGNDLVGCAELVKDFIDVIAVAPPHQGKGYGKALTEFSANALRDRGHSTVRTSVVVGNTKAETLYDRLGFERSQTNEWACLKLAKLP
ncbi:MAG: GNAT family N-acetyltransferase [Bacillota bacterium]